MKYVVNVQNIVTALTNLGGKASAKQIQDKVLIDYCFGKIPENYASERSFRQTIQRKIEDYCPQAEGFNAKQKDAKFIRVTRGYYRFVSPLIGPDIPCTEELPDTSVYPEGSSKKILVNAYERSPEARSACISHYGCECFACGFSYEKEYGELGKAYIQVHHKKPLSDIGTHYHVDPVSDLVPLCANCHAMVHRTTPPLPIEELKTLLSSINNQGK